jgi:hypothetical protein
MEEKEKERTMFNWRHFGEFIVLLVLLLVGAKFWHYETIISHQQKEIENLFFLSSDTQIQKRVLEQLELKRIENEKEFISKLESAIESLQPRLDPSISKMIVRTTLEESKKKKLDPYLILSIMFVESSIDPLKESSAGAVGIMQVRFPTWKEQPELQSNGVDRKYKLFWIEPNIKAGTDIFDKYYSHAQGDIFSTLYRYNTGSTIAPKDKAQFDVNYTNKIFYYAFKIRDLVEGERRHEPSISTGEKKN